MSDQHTKEDIQLSQDRRDKILSSLLEWMTGPDIDSKTLGHFRFIASMFTLGAIAREACHSSTVIGRQELAVSLMIAAINLALDETPPQPSERVLKQREAPAAAKEFKQSVTNWTGSGKLGKPSDQASTPDRSQN